MPQLIRNFAEIINPHPVHDCGRDWGKLVERRQRFRSALKQSILTDYEAGRLTVWAAQEHIDALELNEA